MKTEADYRALLRDLFAVEGQLPSRYLIDENVDRENVLVDGRTERSPDYWPAMYSAACMAAGQRAENEGFNINDMLGRVIY